MSKPFGKSQSEKPLRWSVAIVHVGVRLLALVVAIKGATKSSGAVLAFFVVVSAVAAINLIVFAGGAFLALSEQRGDNHHV